ncbi:MAG: CoA transferase [Chloroflexi bacterium]|nr:CoA transferase [Chloroflexota bacterium]
MTLPLEGYRVCDLGQVWAGPVLGHLFGDMGAEVIRVESRASSDQMRNIAKEPSEIRTMLEKNFVFRNRTSCITLNFTKPQGVELVKEIVKRCDIVFENFSPRVLAKFGLDYASLRKAKPNIIMCSMSAAGQNGPYRDLLGYGPSINSISGVDSLVGYPGDDKLMVNVWDADPTTATAAAFAILTALHHREATGEGQYIDLSFYENLVSLIGEGIMDFTMNGRIAEPQGNRHLAMGPHGIYPCKGNDKWIAIAVKTQPEWEALANLMGNPDWTQDERFVDLYGRLTHPGELDEKMAKWTRGYGNYELMHMLQKAGIAAAVVATLEDVYLDPHDQYRRQGLRIETQGLDRTEVIHGIPWHLSDTPGSVRRLAAAMGEDNEKVFSKMLGLSKKRIEQLVKAQVIY